MLVLAGCFLILVSLVLMVASFIVHLVKGAKHHIAYPITMLLFFPIPNIIFAVKHWQDAKLGCLLKLAAFLCLPLGCFLILKDPEYGPFIISLFQDVLERKGINFSTLV